MKKIKMTFDEYEYGLIINAVNELRNKYMQEGKSTDFITEVLEKLLKKS